MSANPANVPRKRLLSTRGVGEKFDGAAPKTVRIWESTGVIPKADVVINGHKFWDEDNLDAHVRQRMIEGVEKRPHGQFDGRRNKRSIAAE